MRISLQKGVLFSEEAEAAGYRLPASFQKKQRQPQHQKMNTDRTDSTDRTDDFVA
jgi:hypothetical protein